VDGRELREQQVKLIVNDSTYVVTHRVECPGHAPPCLDLRISY